MSKIDADDADQELVMDQSAYEMYHQAQTNAPCLSFDVIKDDLGENREKYPHTCFLVSGTQADASTTNNIIVMKMSNLKRTFKDTQSDSEESDSDDDGDADEQPELEAALIKHNGCVNRIRTTQINGKNICASWSELGIVYLWDLTLPLRAVSDPSVMTEFVKTDRHLPLFQFNGHQAEGYALDWSSEGSLLTGDNTKNIHLWKCADGGAWNVDQRPFIGHTSSVEDIQWSPNESTVFASCSSDKSIRIWDTRAAPHKANQLTCDMAHSKDVNVINWNRTDPFIVSGGDDGLIKIWDLRLFQEKRAVGILKYHSKPITSVEWNANDSTVFAAASEDNKITLWDLAVEKDDKELDNQLDENDNKMDTAETSNKKSQTNNNEDLLKDIPPQLLFIHEGQKEMKELHWHRQIPGCIISTAHSGFNIFKTISV